MPHTNLTDFTLPADGYATFDAVSLKRLIIDRLNENSLFTDQNFEGSNLSSLIDIFATAYHTLLFYLNQSATESLFNEAQLYENMNRIVKVLDYKPVGPQSSILPFAVTASLSLSKNTYTIPRYSFINANGVFYSFKQDITFSKTTSEEEILSILSNNNLLYQGKFEEYSQQTAIGENFETLTILPGDDILIDNFNIYAYIKPIKTGKWEEWSRTSSLFLEASDAQKYEIRHNENKRYEIKFGDNNTGKKLQVGDIIAIYYLKSEGIEGVVGPGALDNNNLNFHNTVKFIEIFDQVKKINTTYLTIDQAALLTFKNSSGSTEYHGGETVEDIRERAPKTFSSQFRLISKDDYEGFILQNFSNIIRDVVVANNSEYTNGHVKYLIEELGLNSPTDNGTILNNQVLFADACDFNNVYIYAVPKIEIQVSTNDLRVNNLKNAQKSEIINSIREVKTVTAETLVVDPVYVAVNLGITPQTTTLSPDVINDMKIIITRAQNSRSSSDQIKTEAFNIINNYFKNSMLGQTISITDLTNKILDITGVKALQTKYENENISINGLSLLVWNPIYQDKDIKVIASDLNLPFFKFPYLFNAIEFINKIEVVTEMTTADLNAEF